MTTANYEGFAFRLSGLTTGPGSTIPIGTSLQKVVLTTRDLLDGVTSAAQTNDARGLITGEGANFLINGSLITSVTPSFRAVQLNTDAGSITALVFTVGADSYAIPFMPLNNAIDFDAATVITSASTLNTQAVSIVNPISYGLLPEDANTYQAQIFNTQSSGSPTNPPISTQVNTTTLFDTDLIRGNGEIQFQPEYTETLATVQFTDGTVLGGVETLQFSSFGGFVNSTNYLFDTAALAASGKTINDVANVLSSFAFDHDLNWNEVGFTLTAGPVANGGGDDVPPPPPPPPPVNFINGTSRADRITGTDGRDGIRGFDGNDTMTGGAGNDAFIFGTDARSGRRSVDVITDYTVGQDVIGFEGPATVRSIVDNGSAIVITLLGDGDRIVVKGAALNVSDIVFVQNNFEFI
jgi:RTX calcium-binding nonapeptide repeat (4 copies)